MNPNANQNLLNSKVMLVITILTINKQLNKYIFSIYIHFKCDWFSIPRQDF